MTATATWSTHTSSQQHTPDAASSGLSDLHIAWTLSAPARQRHLDVAARYRKLDTLTIGEFRTGPLRGHRPPCAPEAPSVEPGQLVIWDSETAHDFEVLEAHRELYLLLPRERVPAGLARAALRPAFTAAVGPGSGLLAVAAEQLRAINRELDHLSDAGLAIACQSLFDVLDSALTPPAQRPSVNAALLIKVKQYIEDHLDDPQLSPSGIAAAQAISVRRLHLLFADTGTTVSRWIRDRRLRICYRELSRAGHKETVTNVAFRWGFNDAAHFSRTFKQAFGVAPSSILTSAKPECSLAG
jgi:AraC-like DNA-binding protein